MQWILIYSAVLDIGYGPDGFPPSVEGIFPTHWQCEEKIIERVRGQSSWDIQFVNAENKEIVIVGSFAKKKNNDGFEALNCSPFRE